MASRQIETKAKKIIDEQRVYESFRTRDYSRFVVEGDRQVYHVHLWKDDTMECTCPYWTYQRKLCSHIMASHLYHNPHRRDVEADPEPELSMAEIERIVAQMPDLFDPETWK